MKERRQQRLNSLLKEVISEVISTEVRNPLLSKLLTVTRVDISTDLHQAKVYISVIGDNKERQQTIDALNSAGGYIGIHAAKKVVMRYFPTLHFVIDTTVDEHMKIEKILQDIHEEQHGRNQQSQE
jgi:ribosome-binding factor A